MTSEPYSTSEDEISPEDISKLEKLSTFDPTKHFTLLKGKRYIEVKWRLVWFQAYAAEKDLFSRIITEIHRFDDGIAIVQATAQLVNQVGQIVRASTGIGQEEKRDFGDYLEKAETKAIGRALSVLGFGTQFAGDMEMDGQVVDSPIAPRQTPAPFKKPVVPTRSST